MCKDCGGGGICAIDYECRVCDTGPSAPELSKCECNPLCIRGFRHGGRGGHSKYATEIKTAMVLADALMLPSDDEEPEDDNDASSSSDELQAVPVVGGGVVMVSKSRIKPSYAAALPPMTYDPFRVVCASPSGVGHHRKHQDVEYGPQLAAATAAHNTDEGEVTTISRLAWSPAEDALILRAVEQLGPKWRKIAALLPKRSDDAVRNRWRRLSEAQRTVGAAAATTAAAAAPGAPAEGSSALEAPAAIDRSSVYKCSRCGQPKKSHVCTARGAIGGDSRGSGLPLAADVLLCAMADSLTMPVVKKPKRDEGTAGPSIEHAHDTHDARAMIMAAMLPLQEWPHQGGHQWPYQAQEQQFHGRHHTVTSSRALAACVPPLPNLCPRQ